LNSSFINSTIDTNNCSVYSDSSNIENSVSGSSPCIYILCLNCCGLQKRLNYPEFEILIKLNDIVCFSETKTDDLDKIELESFEFKMKNRGKFLNRKSGRLVVGYKKELESKIKTLSTESKFVFFGLKLVGRFFI